MFVKLRTAKHLKARASGNVAAVEITGRSARIAAVHQYGLLDQPQRGGPEIRYPARQLLGFSADDFDWLQAQLLQRLRAVQ